MKPFLIQVDEDLQYADWSIDVLEDEVLIFDPSEWSTEALYRAVMKGEDL